MPINPFVLHKPNVHLRMYSIVLSLLVGLLAFTSPVHGWNDLPLWAQIANSSTRGTICHCDYQNTVYTIQTTGLCDTIYSNNSFVDPIPGYKCTCGTNTVTCGFNDMSDSLAYTDGLTLCSDLNATVGVDYSATAPTCIDDLGQTCGGRVGVRTDYRKSYFEPEVGVFLNGGIVSTQGQQCRITTVRALCTTPLCPVHVQDCVEQINYSPWSACSAYQDSCIKTRVKAIAINATAGGVPCRSLETRTQTSPCTLEECQLLRCNYTLQTVTGNCSTRCGDGLRNQTVYNVSTTPLAICSEDLEPIVSFAEVKCTDNLPCASADEPINITCETRGHQGFRNSAVKYVVVKFGVAVTSNHSNVSLSAAFRIFNSASRRKYFFHQNGVIFNDTEILFPLRITSADMAMNTGDTFTLEYVLSSGLNYSVLANEQTVNAFSCNTTDGVPPVPIMAWINEGSEGRNLAFLFSEPVYPTSSFVPSNIFTYNNVTTISSNGNLFTLSNPHLYYRSVSSSSRFYPNSTVQIRAQTAKDGAENLIEITGDKIPIQIFDFSTAGFLPDGTGDTLKLLSNNSAGELDTAFVAFPFPFSKAVLEAGETGIRLNVTAVVNGTTLFGVANSVHVYFEDEGIPGDEMTHAMSFLVKFDNPVNRVIRLLNGSSDGITFSYKLDVPSELLEFVRPTGFDAHTTPANRTVVLVEGFRVLQVVADVGTPYICVNFSSVKPDDRPFVVADFLYQGPNAVEAIENQTDAQVCLLLHEAVTFDAIDFDKLVVVDSNALSIATPRTEYSIGSLIGVRPRVIGVEISSTNAYKHWDRIKIRLDAPIGEMDEDLTNVLVLTWENTLIESIVPTAVTVSGNSATFVIKVTCFDICSDTSGKVWATVRGIYSTIGALVYPSVLFPVVDLTGPQLVSALKMSDSGYWLTFSETVNTGDVWSFLSPTPTKCSKMTGREAVCVFAAAIDPSEVFVMQDTRLKDPTGNYGPAIIRSSIDVLHDTEGCASAFELPMAWRAAVLFFSFASAPTLAAGVVLLYTKYAKR